MIEAVAYYCTANVGTHASPTQGWGHGVNRAKSH